ncbi:MAG TPA: BON domain-containing protein [Bryobacteraceae bacterium]|nr:BON domain-containing protein [Bryobacteraceae bacterium]
MKGLFRKAIPGLAAAVLIAPVGLNAAVSNTKSLSRLENEVRHELVMLPWFSIFDNLKFQVRDNNEVVLSGQVTRPTLKADAQRVVERIEGVERVVNNVEVLPLSPFDDRIRMAVARSIFGYGPMYRYALGANPPIHIIVKNGHVTLEGIVANEMDKNIANLRANSVSGVFSVTNNLAVENARG